MIQEAMCKPYTAEASYEHVRVYTWNTILAARSYHTFYVCSLVPRPCQLSVACSMKIHALGESGNELCSYPKVITLLGWVV